MSDVVETGTTSTPASAPSPAPTPSPATADGQTQSTTDRPSFGEGLKAFNEVAKLTGRKQRGPAEAHVPAPAAVAPVAAATAVDPAAPVAKGPIPFDVHDTALKNARQKERAIVTQELTNTLGDLRVASEAVHWFNSARQDRAGFIRNIIQEALADPDLAPQIASIAGHTLRGGKAAAPAQAEEPQPDFQDGQGHQFYSAQAQQQREAWLRQSLRDEILGEVRPDLEQVRAEREQRDAQAADRQREGAISTHLAEAQKSWPYFDQFKGEIREAIAAMPLTDGHPASEAAVLRRAYDQVVFPKLEQLQQEKVAAKFKADAHASTLNPAATGAGAGVPQNVRAKTGGSFANALKWAQTQTTAR